MALVLDPDTLEAARKGKREALVRVLAGFYPQVYRMSLNLVGSTAAGRATAERVMRQSTRAAESWEHEETPGRWFRHHTVLAARAAPSRAGDDPLLQNGPQEPAYVAFVRALRGLANQQREAFLLHHGEGFDARQLGIAMDCSVEAARVHLDGATKVLSELVPGEFARRVEQIAAAYHRSEPEEKLAIPYARRLLRPGFFYSLGLALAWLILLALLIAVGYAIWWLWPRIVT